MAQNSDDEIFTSIIQSMGIHNYDPLVITALNEYARRYAGSLLLDANDYAEHADRQVSCIHFSDVMTMILCKGNLQSLGGQKELSPI
jgi:histone H3/H4